MPVITNAFTTYGATGNREDLSNTIYNIDPFDTPVMSAIRRRSVKNRYFDWQTESLPSVNLSNAQLEGFLNAPDASTPTVRPTNATQISKRDATVSGSQEESDAAGKGSEMAHQMALISKVLKSDMESIMCSRQARSADNSGNFTTTARLTESIPHWLGRWPDRLGVTGLTKTSSAVGGCVVGVFGVVGTSGLPSGQTTTMTAPAAPVSLTETIFNDGMQLAYTNGATPTLWILPPGCKRTASSFTGRSTTQVLVGKTEVVNTVDVFATDFGRVKVIPSRWLPADIGLIMDVDYWAVAFFRSFKQYMMSRTGDAENRMLVVEWGIEARNPLASVLMNGIKP
jgi:hypothetical protein